MTTPRTAAAILILAGAAAAPGCWWGEAADAAREGPRNGGSAVTPPPPAEDDGAPQIDDPRTRGEALPEPQHLEPIDLVIGGKRIRAELARNDAARQLGLMGRLDVGGDAGMLFVYAYPKPLTFWMKNTPSPLSIAFIGDDGRIFQIDDLIPFNLRELRSREACRLALEMPRGWFAANGVKPGNRVFGLERADEGER